MKQLILIATLLSLCSPAFSQFHIPKLPGTTSPSDALNTGGNFISYLTVASDQGMKALDELAAAFPPDKVAAFKILSAKYHEASAKRTNNEIDSESFIVLSDAGDEMAKLAADWQSYNKEGARSVRKAHQRLGLMLLADGEASARTPKLTRDLESAARTAAVTRQANQAQRLRAMIALLATVSQQVPRQNKSFTTVRQISKNISAAEHFQLPDDPPPQSVTTTAEMTSQATRIDAEELPAGSSAP